MGLAAKVLFFFVGLAFVLQPSLFRECVEGTTLLVRTFTGDSSRDTAFRALARVVDPPPPPNRESLVPVEVSDALAAAWNGVLSVLPSSRFANLAESYRSRSDEFRLLSTDCDSATAAGAPPQKGDLIDVNVENIRGDYDGAVLFPALDKPALRLTVGYLNGDLIRGIDTAIERALTASGGNARRCRVRALLGSGFAFGPKGYWKWRVLPLEPVSVEFSFTRREAEPATGSP
jgi:hypothetical protein